MDLSRFIPSIYIYQCVPQSIKSSFNVLSYLPISPVSLTLLISLPLPSQRGDNLIRPYEFVKLPAVTEFRFSPIYVSSSEFLGKVKRVCYCVLEVLE